MGWLADSAALLAVAGLVGWLAGLGGGVDLVGHNCRYRRKMLNLFFKAK